jgi:hypothetical protein
MWAETVTHATATTTEHDTTAGVTRRGGRGHQTNDRPGAGSAAAVRHDAADGDTSAHIAGTVHGERGQVPRTSPRRGQPPVQRCQQTRQLGRHARLPPGGVAEQRRQPPVKRPPSDALVQVQPPPPTRLSRNGQRAGLLLRSSGFDPLEAYRPGTRQVGGQTLGLVGEWSPRRPVKAKTASSNLVGAATGWGVRIGPGGPGHGASPPASKADGRRVVGLGVRLSRPPPNPAPPYPGEIPKLDKGPPWKGGRRAEPVRGFESHSLRVFVTICITPGGIPKLEKGTVCYTVRAARPLRGFESHSLRCHAPASAGPRKRSGWLRSPA